MSYTSFLKDCRKCRRGFTLAELLAVLVIMGILIAAVVPSISGLARSAGMRGATMQVRMTLVQARQFSITKSCEVAVLFPDDSNTDANNDNSKGYRALAVMANPNDTSGKAKYVSDWQFLPPGIFMTVSNNWQTNQNSVASGLQGYVQDVYLWSGGGLRRDGYHTNSPSVYITIYEGQKDPGGGPPLGRPNGSTNQLTWSAVGMPKLQRL